MRINQKQLSSLLPTHWFFTFALFIVSSSGCSSANEHVHESANSSPNATQHTKTRQPNKNIQQPHWEGVPLVLMFKNGTTTLADTDRQILREMITAYSKTKVIYGIKAIGHADQRETQSDTEALKLSLLRAEAVVDYLVSDLGVDRNTVEAIAKGTKEPVCTESKMTNARVEIKILCRRLQPGG